MGFVKPSQETSTKSILIIDDDLSSRSNLRQIFECLNYAVYEAGNGKEGIEVYRRNSTDIVITDIFMPEKDGLETIRELRKEFPDVKIIAMSALERDSMDFLKIAGYFGAIHCVEKPLSTNDIINIVSLILDKGPAK